MMAMSAQEELGKAVDVLSGLAITSAAAFKDVDKSEAEKNAARTSAIQAALLIVQHALVENEAGVLTEAHMEQMAKTIESLTGVMQLFAREEGEGKSRGEVNRHGYSSV
jgi:hypothetical protein